MKLLARSHLFLIVAVLILAVLAAGVFWEAPFHADAQGVARLFSRAWEYVVLPVRFVLAQLTARRIEATTTATIVVLVCYLGLFVVLDVILTKVLRRIAG